jgi:hypothetical protein
MAGPLDSDSDAGAQAAPGPRRTGGAASFREAKQIDTGVLNVGYAEDGPADGPAVILLHGWPYDIHTYVDVAPLRAVEGCRVIVPYLRGYGTTRFRSGDTPRNAQQAALGADVIALMNALRLERAPIAGCLPRPVRAASGRCESRCRRSSRGSRRGR